MRVLVCGGRDFASELQMDLTLDGLLLPRGSTIIEGGAQGTDKLARKWGALNGCEVETYPAHWRVDGKAAGPIRNQRMLVEGKPDLVVAFPGGRGTADMVRRARLAGVEVREVRTTPARNPSQIGEG